MHASDPVRPDAKAIVEEVETLEADEGDRAEILAVSELMTALRSPSGPSSEET